MYNKWKRNAIEAELQYNTSQYNLIQKYCKDLDIKLVFSSFKVGSLFGVKDPVPDRLRSRVV